MTTLASRIASKRSAARVLVAMWLTLSAVLTYLGIPLQHSLLFAANLVMQASLGSLVITRLRREVALSLPLLCGPGLILGGALSFAIFQVTGRGIVGIVVATIAGLAAMGALSWSWHDEESSGRRWWMLSQLVGMAALAMSHEFSELAPLALALFALGLALSHERLFARFITIPLALLGTALTAVTRSMWSDNWWLITDDYQIFEVISQHITRSGPFADWGATSFIKYHWLSYGWAGLLRSSSGESTPLVTLSVVMPFVYSVALAASLVLVLSIFRDSSPSRVSIAQVWATVAVLRLDWSGTSTAGVYAALAASYCIAMGRAERRTTIRVLGLLGVFGVILTMTKLTGIFAFLLLLGYLVVSESHFQRWNIPRNWHRILALILWAALLFGLIWVFSQLLDETYRFVRINPKLGQISWFGPLFAAVTLTLQQSWMLIAVIFAVRASSQTSTESRRYIRWFGWLAGLAIACGVALDVTITANSDNHRYLSGPFYFVAALGFMVPHVTEHSLAKKGPPRAETAIILTSFVLAGLTWSQLGFGGKLLDFLARELTGGASLQFELLKFVTLDSRFGVVLVAAPLLLVATVGRRPLRNMFVAFCLAIALQTIVQNGTEANGEFSRDPSDDELIAYLGSPAERQLGEWLSRNVPPGELIATNHLFGEFGGTASDLGLAVWSNREFLVLGPSLGDRQTTKRSDAIRISVDFGNDPSETNCARVIGAGVAWFIVDTRLTNLRDWSPCARKVHQVEDFLVLSLSAKRPSAMDQ